ncbi:MAG: hypothetical protein RL026_1124 [Pseudomonadota bacterium]
MPKMRVSQAGIAQLVERNLAKVEVASSSLVSRSIFLLFVPPGSIGSSREAAQARWQSGHAAACKAVYAGSIPTLASSPSPLPSGVEFPPNPVHFYHVTYVAAA